MTIAMQSGIVYGPMKSRRFGASLGINFLPKNKKLCNFDCVYCQYDTKESTHIRSAFPTLRQIEREFRLATEDPWIRDIRIDWIMIAGNGEPTLHPQFSKAVEDILALRNECFPGVPVGILSNASRCHLSDIRNALARLDGRFMKLDAGSTAGWLKTNRPCPRLEWDEMVEGMRRMDRVVIQSLFFESPTGGNAGPESVNEWMDAIERIRPASVQIYTVDRAPQEACVGPVMRDRLDEILQSLSQRTGILGEVFF
jgi:wyosine [tRNA(Phe)-imidazoG37] synthetase (radical SAM superfamily)